MKRSRDGAGRRRLARLPKLCGADIELGNFITGLHREGGTGYEASRALLREIDGLPRARYYQYGFSYGYGSSYSSGGGYDGYGWGSYSPQDWGRKFLPSNGGCVYIDLDHLELCVPEVMSAFDHVAASHAMLQIARAALEAANERLPAGQKIRVHVNNSDGQSNSYGSHSNFLITRRAWNNIFHRKLHYQLFLAAFQVSSIVLTGQGKVGSENRAPAVPFQLSQRADFFETLSGEQTTYRRPLVNSRDESLCGSDLHTAAGMARLHCIFFDNTLCHASGVLRTGIMQIVLAMIEAEQVNPQLILDDPIGAVRRWSHDPTLQAREALTSGRKLTAVEVQLLFLEEARRFADAGGCEGIVPRAEEILALWQDTLQKLGERDWAALASRLDWALKRFLLERAMSQRSELTWRSPELKHLDHMYSSLDPADGLYWACERSGLVERYVTDAEIDRFLREPPDDTRAWTRARLLRIGGEDVEAVDWDAIKFTRPTGNGWSRRRTLDMPDPLGLTKRDTAALFNRAANLDEALDWLEQGAVSERTIAAGGWANEGACSHLRPAAAGTAGWNGNRRHDSNH